MAVPSIILGPFFLLIVVLPYFLPTIIAIAKKKRNAGAIALLNIFLGWTIIGWIVAMVWAFTADAPTVTITNVSNYPSAPPPAIPAPPTMGAAQGTGASPAAVFCQSCGAKLQPGAQFCPSCGRHIT
jgi:Superinfection immunity protein/zinc-ribbon domain